MSYVRKGGYEGSGGGGVSTLEESPRYVHSLRERRHQPMTMGLLPTVPKGGAPMWALMGAGLLFAYLVLRPQPKKNPKRTWFETSGGGGQMSDPAKECK